MQDIQHRLIVRDFIDQISSRIPQLSVLFFTHLFRLHPSLTDVFNGGAPMLNRKFGSMIATFKSIKHLEKISPALQNMAKRHLQYHAEMAHFPSFREALLLALSDLLGSKFTPELKQAWQKVFDEVAAIMIDIFKRFPVHVHTEEKTTHDDATLLADIGGVDKVFAVHQTFYDSMYEDSYLLQFFAHRAKHTVVRKQTEFMVAAFGGENHYHGEPPAFVHMHMFITKEMSDIRVTYLRQAILSHGLSQGICERWLRVDHTFHASIDKNSEDDCVMRCMGQQPFVIKKPFAYVAPK